jgi:hypothetical protein
VALRRPARSSDATVFQLNASSSRSDIGRRRAASVAAGAASGSRTKSATAASAGRADSLGKVTGPAYRAAKAPGRFVRATRYRLLSLHSPAIGSPVDLVAHDGTSERDFRAPDGGLHRPGAAGTWLPTAALVVEIVSPEDETWEKLPFYAAHDVDEVQIVDPAERKVH